VKSLLPAVVLAAAIATAIPSLAAEPVVVRAAPHPGYGRIVFDWKTPVEHRATLDGRTLTVRFARPLTAKLELIADRLPDHVASVRMNADGQTVVVTLKDEYKLRPGKDGNVIYFDLLAREVAKVVPAAGATAPPKPAKPDALDEAVQRALKPTLLQPQSAEKPAEGSPFVSVDVAKGRDIATLRFNWREDVGAAVFRRRGQAWVVFDTKSRIELSALRIGAAPIVAGADQIEIPGGSAVRLAIDPSRHLRVRRERTVWVVEVLDANPATGKSINVIADPDDAGGRIALPIKSAGKVLRLQDPEVGDVIHAVTVTEAGLGVAEPHRFVEVEVLESAQGIAIRPAADGVVVEASPSGVVVGKPGGLRVSRDADRGRRTGGALPRGSLFDFISWAKGPAESFGASRQELIRRAAATERKDAKRAIRLTLARYYLAHGFGPEALGVIHEIVRSEVGKSEDVELRALRGAARVLAGDFGFANDDFKHPVLESNPETAPWRATIAAARGDWKTAQQQFRELDRVFDSYPNWLAARMGLLAAEASLAVGDAPGAAARIEALAKRDLAENDRDALGVLRGYQQKLAGDVDGAIAAWRATTRSTDRRNQARARYALANAQLERKEITVDEAIDRMERLRYAWRGDVHEFDLLRRLAQLYVERDDSRGALQTLKEAATHFRNIEGVQGVVADMAKTYHYLFAEGGADRLPAVAALALFDEFRELTPTGAEGDALMRSFAERLAAMDLLDEAARLLEQQVKFRLKDEEKARVGLRLAELRLAEKKPTAAIGALDESLAPNIPAELVRDRRRLEAEALAAMDKRDEAMAALANDDGIAAERLRAVIHWRAKAWKEAAQSFDRLIERGKPSEEELPRLVLTRAVALALAGDEKAVSALYAKQRETMKKSAYADAFEAVAAPGVGAARDYRAAAKIASEIAAMQSMLARKGEVGS
jgi:hypothetical protein